MPSCTRNCLWEPTNQPVLANYVRTYIQTVHYMKRRFVLWRKFKVPQASSSFTMGFFNALSVCFLWRLQGLSMKVNASAWDNNIPRADSYLASRGVNFKMDSIYLSHCQHSCLWLLMLSTNSWRRRINHDIVGNVCQNFEMPSAVLISLLFNSIGVHLKFSTTDEMFPWGLWACFCASTQGACKWYWILPVGSG